MMNFGRLEDLMYSCRINLYWTDKETGEFIDLTDAEVVSLNDNEIVLKDKKGLNWSYDVDVLEAKLSELVEDHCNAMRNAFKSVKDA